MPNSVPDLRGRMIRARRQMSDADSRTFLREQKIAHIGTVDANGWPYVIPLTYIYLGDEWFWFHTGGHHGHFLTNLEHSPRVCATISAIGGMETSGDYLCDGSQLYTSVILFGETAIIPDPDKKNWFFDRLREKYVPAEVCTQLSPEYPDINKIILYRTAIEVMTGKRSSGVGH